MADVQPLKTLRYEPDAVGGLEAVIAPPYDVIDDQDRARLLEKSPFNVVEIDLPQSANGADPYSHAREKLDEWREEGVVVRESEPALWASSRSTPPPTASGAPGAASSRACAWRTTGPAGSGRTSAPIRAPRRTGCA